MELSFVTPLFAAPQSRVSFHKPAGLSKQAVVKHERARAQRRFFGHAQELSLFVPSERRKRELSFDCVCSGVNGVGSVNPKPQPGPVKQPQNEQELDVLTKELQELLKNVSVYLVGMMGCGKSTVGKALASRLGYKYLDTDAIIEQFAKKPIPQIFEQDGEPAFRDMESEVLRNVAPLLGCVISTGGGVVIRPKNWSYLQTGIVVWLDVAPEILHARLSNPDASAARPLLAGEADALMDKLNKLISQRKGFYGQADVTVDAGGAYFGYFNIIQS
eukprot:tig00020912_g15791.t1